MQITRRMNGFSSSCVPSASGESSPKPQGVTRMDRCTTTDMKMSTETKCAEVYALSNVELDEVAGGAKASRTSEEMLLDAAWAAAVALLAGR